MVKTNDDIVNETASQYEFTGSQNQTIGTLARRMLLVGMVLILFGVFQMVNGVTSVIMSRSPERVIAAAEKAGMSADQIEQLKLAAVAGLLVLPVYRFLAGFCSGRFIDVAGRYLDAAGSGWFCGNCPD